MIYLKWVAYNNISTERKTLYNRTHCQSKVKKCNLKVKREILHNKPLDIFQYISSNDSVNSHSKQTAHLTIFVCLYTFNPHSN